MTADSRHSLGLSEDKKAGVIRTALEIQARRRPDLFAGYDERQREHVRRDTAFHLSYLAEALEYGSFPLFSDYVSWL